MLGGFALCLTSARNHETKNKKRMYPNHIIITDNRPGVAVFIESKCSFAISADVYALWADVAPMEHVTDADFARYTTVYPVVADIASGRNIRGFAVTGDPGCLVVTYRDGRNVRHYVDDPAWATAVGLARWESVTLDELVAIAPDRGPDFHRSVPVAPPPPPKNLPKDYLTQIGNWGYAGLKNTNSSRRIGCEYTVYKAWERLSSGKTILNPEEQKILYREGNSAYTITIDSAWWESPNV